MRSSHWKKAEILKKEANSKNKVGSQTLFEKRQHKFISWHQVIFPQGPPWSIFTSYAFHNQVRDGLVWFHASVDTRNLSKLFARATRKNIVFGKA